MLSLPFPIQGTNRLFPGRGHLSFGDRMLFFFVLGHAKEYLSRSVQFATQQTSPKMKICVKPRSQETGPRSAGPQDWQYAAAAIKFQAIPAFFSHI